MNEKILELIGQIDSLKKEKPFSPKFNCWNNLSERYLKSIFGEESDQLSQFKSISYSSSFFVIGGNDSSYYDYINGLEEAKLMLQSFLNDVPNNKDSNSKSSEHYLEKILNRFHVVATQIKRRREKRSTLEINDEYDLQDLLHALLKIDFQDIRPEEWVPSYAGNSSRMDFLLPNDKIAIETKKTRKGLSTRNIIEQVIIDIAYYQKHQDVKTLYCFIYDPEFLLENPASLSELDKNHGNLKVKIITNPLI